MLSITEGHVSVLIGRWVWALPSLQTTPSHPSPRTSKPPACVPRAAGLTAGNWPPQPSVRVKNTVVSILHRHSQLNHVCLFAISVLYLCICRACERDHDCRGSEFPHLVWQRDRKRSRERPHRRGHAFSHREGDVYNVSEMVISEMVEDLCVCISSCIFLILFFLGRGIGADQDLQRLALSKRSVWTSNII